MDTLQRGVTLYLLTVAVAAMVMSAPHTLILSDPSGRLEVPFGGSLNLSCGFTVHSGSRVIVKWCFASAQPSNHCSEELSTKLHINTTGANKTWSNFSRPSVDENHTGWYICQVTDEIPFPTKYYSNATEVVVTKSKMEVTTNALVTAKQVTVPAMDIMLQDWRFMVALGGSGVVLLGVIVIALCISVRRRRRRSYASESPVYANTRPVGCTNRQPSPRPGMQPLPPSKHLRTPNTARKQEGISGEKPSKDYRSHNFKNSSPYGNS